MGSWHLELIDHHDDIAGLNDHFGTLLFDTAGRLSVHAGSRTWLHTGSLVDGRWLSFARELDLDTLAAGETQISLVAHDDDWATIRLVLRVSETLFVAFYSTGTAVRAAVADEPAGPFRAVPGFAVRATEPWEIGATIESDGGFHAVSEDPRQLVGWVLHDTLAEGTAGHNGWALVRIDKAARTVELVGKHPATPLGLLLPGRLDARTGGNLSSDVRIAGRRALFYLGPVPFPANSRIGRSTAWVTCADKAWKAAIGRRTRVYRVFAQGEGRSSPLREAPCLFACSAN